MAHIAILAVHCGCISLLRLLELLIESHSVASFHALAASKGELCVKGSPHEAAGHLLLKQHCDKVYLGRRGSVAEVLRQLQSVGGLLRCTWDATKFNDQAKAHAERPLDDGTTKALAAVNTAINSPVFWRCADTLRLGSARVLGLV